MTNTKIIKQLLLGFFLFFIAFSSLTTQAQKQVIMQKTDTILIKLPKPNFKGNISVEEVLLKRRSVREFKDTAISISELSQILWAAYGISDSIKKGGKGLHTAPSAGALYPLVIYIVVGNVTALPSGIYHYIPKGHSLILVKTGDFRSDLCDATSGQQHVKNAPVDIVYAAVFERTAAKYGERGRQRYVYIDLGLSAENVYLQTTSLNMGTCCVGSFTDEKVFNIIEMPKEEAPLLIMPVGKLKDEK